MDSCYNHPKDKDKRRCLYLKYKETNSRANKHSELTFALLFDLKGDTTMQKKKNEFINQFKEQMKEHPEVFSNTDVTLLEIVGKIICSELTDGQKMLLMYFLHSELCQEVTKDIAKRKDLKEKIYHNPLEKYKKLYPEILKTGNEYEKIRNLIGEALYEEIASSKLTENMKSIAESRFIYSADWFGESYTNRSVKKILRGFDVIIPKDKKENE